MHRLAMQIARGWRQAPGGISGGLVSHLGWSSVFSMSIKQLQVAFAKRSSCIDSSDVWSWALVAVQFFGVDLSSMCTAKS